jgi:hypothetical protein
MNKEIVKAVSKKQFQLMMDSEKELKKYLNADTGGRPQATLSGLFNKIEQLLTTMSTCQDRIMLLQQMMDEEAPIEKIKSE